MRAVLQAEIINKVNIVNMPGVEVTRVNRMLPSCPSFRRKRTLCCPDGHLSFSILTFSLQSGSSLIAICNVSHLEHMTDLGLRNPRLKSVLNTLQ